MIDAKGYGGLLTDTRNRSKQGAIQREWRDRSNCASDNYEEMSLTHDQLPKNSDVFNFRKLLSEI